MTDSPAALLLFVYGSLKHGERNAHHLGPGAELIGSARTAPGYRLFELGGYPGMVACPDDLDGVIGEVWSIPVANLPHLDSFEGAHLDLYRRGPIVLQPPFADQAVQTYHYARSVEGCMPIGSFWTGR